VILTLTIVISLGDTGIDYDSCFFHDPAYAVPVDSVRMEHRKIVMYMAFGDAADAALGHGTHVVCCFTVRMTIS
jgi:hypothetical protein